MKKNLLLIAILLLNLCVFAQQTGNTSDNYYYHNGKKVELQVNKHNFTVYFDLGKTTKSIIAKNYNIIREISLSDEKGENIFCCVVEIENTDYDKVVSNLRSKTEVIDVEPVIGLESIIPVSNVFYVQLKNESLYDEMAKIVQETKTRLIGPIEDCKNWYELECTKVSVTNALQASGYLGVSLNLCQTLPYSQREHAPFENTKL